MQKLSRSFLAAGMVALAGLAACGDDVSVAPPPVVVPAVTGITVSPPSLSLQVGGRGVLSAVVTANDPSVVRTVTWVSNTPAVATVSATGEVTAVTVGSTTITARSSDPTFTASAQVIVTAATRGVRSVTVTPAAITVAPGEVQQISANVDADPGVARSVTYVSSSTSIATVTSAGAVTGVAAGTATIKVASTVDTSIFANVAVTVRAPVAAIVSIQSITTGNTTVPVNISNVFGQIDVSINLTANDERISSLDLLVDNTVVASQTFAAAAQLAMLESSAFDAAGIEPAAGSLAATAAAAADVIVLSFRTDKFNPTTGVVDFLNGNHIIRARANVATAQRASNSIALVFNNNSGFYVTLDNVVTNGSGIKSATSPSGIAFVGGNVIVTSVPVIYSPTTPNGTTAETVCIRTVSHPGSVGKTVGTTAACVSGVSVDTLSLAGYQSAGLDLPSITGVYTSGQPILFNANPAAPLAVGGIVNVGVQPAAGNQIFGNRFDNIGPIITTTDLTRTAPAVTGWVNAAFSFLTNGVDVVSADAGVGLRATRDFAGQYTGCPFVTPTTTTVWINFDGTGATIPECAVDFTGGATPGPYVARGTETDRLGNLGVSAVTGRFGVDKTLPTVRISAGSTAALAVLSPGPINFQSEALDDRAGFLAAGLPGDAFSHFAANASGAFPSGTCAIGTTPTGGIGAAFVTAPLCGRVSVPGPYPVLVDGFRQGPLFTSTAAGYWNYSSVWTDQAGNASAPLGRLAAVDLAFPLATGLNVPANINPLAFPAFAVTFTDDVEGIGYSFGIFYPAVGNLRYPRTNVNLLFDDLISTPGQLVAASPYGLPFVRRVEIVDAGNAVQAAVVTNVNAKPNQATGTVFDVFGYSASTSASILAGNVETGAPFATFNTQFPQQAVVQWRIIPLAAGFLAPAGLKAQVMSPFNSTNSPFARVDFYRSVGGEFFYLGSSTTAINSDNGVNRFWTYVAPATFVNDPLTLTPQAQAAAGQTVIAVGVSSGGDGISTLGTVLAP